MHLQQLKGILSSKLGQERMNLFSLDWVCERGTFFATNGIYHIYSINRPGHLLNFCTLRVGAYSRWAPIRGWVLIKFSPFSASEVCLILQQNNKC